MAGVEGGGDAAAVPPFPGLSADGPIHVPPREIRALELVDMVCATVPPQRVGGLIKSLSSCAPFGNEFKHLKRVRRATSEGDQGAQHHLEVLVCSRVPDESAGWGGHCVPRRDGGAEAEPAHDDIPERVRAALAASGVDPASLAVVRVPRHPPEERDQLDAWNAMWPVSYRILPGTTATKTARLVVSEAEASAMRQHIARAWDSAHASLNGGHIFNAAVLVDPARGEVVACAGDGRRASFGSGAPPSACSHHPLKHATMQAIDAVAQGLLEGTNPPAKRACVGASPSPAPPAPAPYLCTGYECYVLREPCTMCAMALVHSRVRRIVYCLADKDGGALGGMHRLHGLRSLNHHYEVFHWPLAER